MRGIREKYLMVLKIFAVCAGQGGHLHRGAPDGLLVQDADIPGLVAHHRHLHHVRIPRVQVRRELGLVDSGSRDHNTRL